MAVFELRVAITAEDFETVVAFYRDGLGLDPGDMWENNGQGQLFHAGRGIVEVLDTTHSAFVDRTEVGQEIGAQIRFAFQVPDIQQAIDNALKYGAKLLADPRQTPWGDLNARLESPDGLQITLFQSKSSDGE